jgi:serine/threonine protein kinase
VTTAPDDPIIGRVLEGRYRVIERVGEGGMATVYRGLDLRLDRPIAIKIMRAHLFHDEAFRQRFLREARTAASITHPHVVGVYDQGEDAGHMFLVMEYVHGTTLRHVLHEQGALSAGQSLDILRRVLQALSAAHRAGLVHRDVKPGNILLRTVSPGAPNSVQLEALEYPVVPLLSDFGIARALDAPELTSAGTVRRQPGGGRAGGHLLVGRGVVPVHHGTHAVQRVDHADIARARL